MSERITAEPIPEIDDQLRRKAEAIALFMGGDYNMTASVGPWGSGWFWDFSKNHVNMDAKDLATEPENVVKGIASHEGNHRLASRPEHVQDLWREPGFAYGFNAVEDPRVNEAGMHHRPGSRTWIKSYIERDLSEGGGLDYHSLQKDAEKSLGYVPKHMQWGADMIRYWYEKEVAEQKLGAAEKQEFLDKIPDEQVRATVESTIEEFEKFYQAIPLTKDEQEVQRKAKQSADIFKDNIWPKYEELVEQAYDDQALVEMLKDMLEADGEPGGGGGQTIEIPFDSLPQEIQDEIKQKMQEQAEKQQQASQASAGEGESQDGEEGEESGQMSGSPGGGDSQDSQGSSSEDQEGPETGGQGTQIPWDKLSDDAKEAAKQAFEGLSDDQQDDYKDQAKESLEGVEDDANEKIRGKMTDPRHNETNRERQEREAKEAEAERQQKAAEAIREQLEQKRQEALDNLRPNTYHEFLSSPDVANAIRRLDKEFKKIFTPDEDPDTRYSYSGLRPSMGKAMQYEADRRKSNIFESKGRPTEKSHRFLWEVDLSNSMQNKIAEAFKVLVINTELANKHDLESAVVGFSDYLRGPGSTKVYKDFDTKRLTKDDRDRLAGILPDCEGGTPLYAATQSCYDMLKARMAQRPMEHNYFITLTDGQPTDSQPEHLAELVKQIRTDRSMVTCGFGIGPGTYYVNEVYPQLHDRIRREIASKLGKPLEDVTNSYASASEFASASVIIMRHMVEHPELFYV